MSEMATYRTGNYYGDGQTYHIWEICDEQGIAAELYVSIERHEIMSIDVRADRRRQGLARTLYIAATAQMPVYHAPAAHRSEEGAAFAEAVGGEAISYPCTCTGCTPEED